MSSVGFYRDNGAKEAGIVTLYAKISIGSTGASTLDAAASKGITSVTRNDTGDYTLLLDAGYQSLLMVDVTYFHATDKDLTWQLITGDVTSAKTVKFGMHAAATPTDPADGSVLLVRITVKNSSV